MLARYGSLAVFLLLVVTAAVVASGFEAGAWYYQDATRPAWTPPPWLFGPAWALAYLALALAAWQAWLSGRNARRAAMVPWLALLAGSVAWSWLMFGLHRPGWAWLELGVLLAVAVFCLRRFRPLAREASVLMLPFAAWIGFLWAWNLALWTLNGGPLARLLS